MKTDSKQLDTLLTVPEISLVLRTFRCEIQSLSNNYLTDVAGEERGTIELLLHGKATMPTMLDSFKSTGVGKSEWAVKVNVCDLGEVRRVELAALGESAVKSIADAYTATRNGRGYIDLANMHVNYRQSKEYRDRIMVKLQPINMSGGDTQTDSKRDRISRVEVPYNKTYDTIRTEVVSGKDVSPDTETDLSESGIKENGHKKDITINQKVIIAAVLAFFAAAILGFVLNTTIFPASTYKSAQKLYEDGEYGRAYKKFAKLGDYKDSANMKAQAGNLYWKTCYRDVLNGSNFPQDLSEYGYSVDDLNSMRSSFDLGYINDDDIPELALKLYKDAFIISIEEDKKHNLSAPEVCRMASGDYYTGIVEIGAYEKQGYIAYEYEENGSTYKEWVPYKHNEDMVAEPEFYREYVHSDTAKDYTDYLMNDGSETYDLARDAFYDEVYKHADPDKYKEFKLKDNTEDNQNSVFS